MTSQTRWGGGGPFVAGGERKIRCEIEDPRLPEIDGDELARETGDPIVSSGAPVDQKDPAAVPALRFEMVTAEPDRPLAT
jgi:hypothetical protein